LCCWAPPPLPTRSRPRTLRPQPGNYTTVQDFTACGNPPCQNFTTAMNVSGSFTVPAPLAANLFGFNLTSQITSYSFSDGINAYSSADPGSRIFRFEVTTDGSGAITAANIDLQQWLSGASPHAASDRVALLSFVLGGSFHNLRCITVGPSPAGMGDSCPAAVIDPGSSFALPYTLTWSAAPTGIPTLSQWGMMVLAGLMGLFAWVRVRRSTD